MITLISGVQLRTLLISRCVTRREPDQRMATIVLATHPDSPTRVRELDVDQVAMIHTEHPTGGNL